MTKQRLDEWLDLNESDLAYHRRQWDTKYRSTEAFARFIEPVAADADLIVDICCGAGGATNAIRASYPQARFIGIDLVPSLIEMAQGIARDRGLNRIDFRVGDCFALEPLSGVDGVTMLQTLCCIDDWHGALDAISTQLKPKWIAASGLFYPGDISCTVAVEEHARGRKTSYNVMAIPQVQRFAERAGFEFSYRPFEIDLDLPKPENPDFLGTYTVRTDSPPPGVPERLQISGPLLMNWGFILLRAL